MSLKPPKPSKSRRNEKNHQKEAHQSLRAALLVSPQQVRPWKQLLKENQARVRR